MADATARLRLQIEGAVSGNPFASIATAAETAARAATQALNGISGGKDGALGGAATMGPLIPDSALSSLVNMRESVKLTRSSLEEFYTNTAKNYGLEVGKNIADPTKVASADLASFHESVTGVKTSVDEAAPKLDNLGKMFALDMIKQASAAVKEFGETVLKVLGEGMKSAAEFESTTVTLQNALQINVDPAAQSVGGLTGRLDELKQKATDVALVTKFNDSDILNSMTLLAQNGIASDRILNGAASSAANMAQATKTELIPATEALTGIMHGFSKTLGQQFGDDTEKGLGRVADIMTNISLSTGGSLTDISNSMKYVAPVADEFGMKFEDVATSVDVLYRSGIRGSQTGTALKRMMTNIAAPTEGAATAIDELAQRVGLSGNMFITAEGKVKPMIEIQRLLHDSTEGLSDAQKAQSMHTIFGQYALQSMMKLAGTAPDQFKSLADMVTQSGTAAKVSSEWAQTAEGRWQAFTENIGVAKRQLGTELLTAAKNLLAPFNDLVTVFTNLSPETKKIIATTLAVGGALAVVAGTLGGLIAGFGLFQVALTAAGLTLGGIAATVGTVIVAIAAVAAVAYLVYEAWATNFGGLRDLVTNVWNYVQPTFINAAIAIKDAVVGAVQGVMEWWAKIQPSLEGAVTNIIAVLTFFAPVFKAMWEGFSGVVSAVWNTIVGVIQGAWNIVSGIFQFFVHLFSGEWGKLWDDVKQIFSGAWQIIASVFKGAWDVIVALVTSYWHGVVGLYGKMWDEIKASTSEFFTTLINWFKNLPSSVAAHLAAFGTWLSTNIKAAWTAITDWTTDMLTSMKTWFTNLPTKIAESIGFVAGWLSKEIPKAWTAITTWLTDMVNAYVKFWTDLPGKILQGLTNVGTWLAKNIPTAWTAVTTWLTDMVTAYVTFWVDLPGKILQGIVNVGTWLAKTLTEQWTGFTTWLIDVWTSISGWFTALPGKMMNSFTSIVTQVTAVGKSLGNAIWDGIKSVLNGIGDYVVNLVNGAINAAKHLWESFKSGFRAGQAAADGGSSNSGSGDSGGDTYAHAAGGIFTRPTWLANHLFGEAGPEAIVPLNKQNLLSTGFELPRRDVDMSGHGGGGNKTVTYNLALTYNGPGGKDEADRFTNATNRMLRQQAVSIY